MNNDFYIKEGEYVEIILRNKNRDITGIAVIDLDDFETVSKHTWSIDTHGYARATKNNKNIWMHKLITNTDGNSLIDHKDRNRLNNRKRNLRIATRSENGINKGIQSNNLSGVAGVSYYKSRDRWVAEIKFEGKKIWIGQFRKKEDAIVARLNKELEMFGELSPQKHLFENYNIGVAN